MVATVIERQGDWYTLEVGQDLLGNVEDVIDVESPGENQAGCGFSWAIGDEVATLVFEAEGRGTVNLCTITDGATLVAAVADAEQPAGPPTLLSLESAPATTTVGRLLVQVAIIGMGLFIGWRFMVRRRAGSTEPTD